MRLLITGFITALLYQVEAKAARILTAEERSFWSAYAQLFPHEMGGVVRSDDSLVQIHWHTSLQRIMIRMLLCLVVPIILAATL